MVAPVGIMYLPLGLHASWNMTCPHLFGGAGAPFRWAPGAYPAQRSATSGADELLPAARLAGVPVLLQGGTPALPQVALTPLKTSAVKPWPEETHVLSGSTLGLGLGLQFVLQCGGVGVTVDLPGRIHGPGLSLLRNAGLHCPPRQPRPISP